MKSLTCFTALLLFAPALIFAQTDTTKTKKKGNFGQTMQQLPEMLVGAPDKSADSAMYFLKNDNFTMTVPPLWQEKGLQTNNDLKVDKINDDPLDVTFPIPEKKLANGIVITMANYKKSPDEKKQQTISQVKQHLSALFKDQQKPITTDQVNQQVASRVVGPEPFTTDQGKQGDLYLIDDFQPQQSSFLVVWLAPGPKPGTCIFVQFNYYHYTYDAIPDEMNDLKVFEYPDDQKAYVDFTKKMLKTLKIE